VKQVLRAFLFLLLRLLGTLWMRLTPRKSQRHTYHAPRILLVRPGHLGDLVLTTPVLDALRSAVPDASITVLASSGPSVIVERHPALDRLLRCPLPSRRDFSSKVLKSLVILLYMAWLLRRERYDLAINLRPRFKWGAVLLFLAGIPCRVGYAVRGQASLLTHTLPAPQGEHVTAAGLRVTSAGLQALGYAPLEEPFTPERYPLTFTPTEQEQAWVKARLRREGIGPSTPVVVIHPGAGAPLKLWRAEAWGRCADAIAHLTRPLSTSVTPRILLTGSPAEVSLLNEVAAAAAAPVTPIVGMNVGQLAALLQRASLVIGVDSGPLHLAVAQGTPTLRIFGPTDARRYGPWGSEHLHRVVASTHRCWSCPAIPCGRMYINPRDQDPHLCMHHVSEQQVLSRLPQLLFTGERDKHSIMSGH
jgi:ADP-heptose:LPS heptosyltransferase